MNLAIEEAWEKWKAEGVHNAIFWDFIERERNLILKEYEFQSGEIKMKFKNNTEHIYEEESLIKIGMELLPRIYALRRALQWYEHQIGNIEERARALRGQRKV